MPCPHPHPPCDKKGKCLYCIEDEKKAKQVKKYGLSGDQWNDMHRKQDGKCAICGKYVGKNLQVDHDHVSGKVRELLCRSCNTGIGHLKDSPRNALNAAKYLRKHYR